MTDREKIWEELKNTKEECSRNHSLYGQCLYCIYGDLSTVKHGMSVPSILCEILDGKKPKDWEIANDN